MIVCKEFCHIFFWWFRLKRIYTAQTVLWCTIAIIRWNLMLNRSTLTLFHGQRFQSDTKVLFIKCFGKIITIINDTVPSKYIDLGADVKIFWRIELLFGHVHTWIASLNNFFWQFLFSEHQWKWILARILESQLLNLDSVVSEEVVQLKMIETTLKCIILPQDFERKYFPIIIDVFLKSIIRMSTSQLDFNILLVLFGVWRVDFCILRPRKFIKKVARF